MNDDIDMLIEGIIGLNRDLNEWQKERSTTGKVPSKEKILEEWKYFTTLLKLAEECHIDKDLIVCEHSRNVVGAFLSFNDILPVSAMAS